MGLGKTVRARRLFAALALAAFAIVTTAACQNPTEAPVPAPPPCPSGQHWTGLPVGKYGCHTGSRG